ncbi:AAA family ATPase [Streptomyces sp. URMC 129]|uniref:AAA family ATPase n=1 Tax=Streptomyces sp. URMC 129 TaxID=3423407 RepID=UPI003F19B701
MSGESGLDELLAAVDGLPTVPPDASGVPRRGDTRDGRVYVTSPEIVTAVKVALVTGRPLLLSGAPGCGKSSLAGYLARHLALDYFEFTVTDSADPQHLLWRMDTVRRLNDAQLGLLNAERGRDLAHPYLEPGPLWWSLSPETARLRGAPPGAAGPDGFVPAAPPVQLPDHTPARPGAVLLIDEIDKADSSFCNGLLVPLGSRQFFVPPIETLVRADEGRLPGSPIVLITTNNERDLPGAFVRRCVALSIPPPDADRLIEIAGRHFGGQDLPEEARQQIALLAKRVTGQEHREQTGRPASTAEFLDLVQTLLALGIGLDSEEWSTVEQLIIEKRDVRSSRLLEW